MKRNFLCLVLLSVAFALACNDTAPNANNGKPGNSNAGNVNSTSNTNNSNVKPTVIPIGKDTKTVAIVVLDEKSGKKITVLPDPVQLDLSQRQNIHFAAVDGLSSMIESIEMDFGAASPLAGGSKFTIGPVDPGGSNSTDTGQAMTLGTFKYTIRVRVKGLTDPITLDPQVEISGGKLVNH